MLFNSFTFFVFFFVVFSLYLLFRGNLKLQNRTLLVASYVFYGWWDWRFLGLIGFSTVVDYFCGLMVHKSERVADRKRFLIMSVSLNLAILGFFKYCNFFAAGFEKLLCFFGVTAHPPILHIILPVGVSFYTFQEIGYIVDVYRGRVRPVRDLWDYALFVAFFPQLMAGPINRAAHLLPQILQPRDLKLDRFYEGSYLVFWGLFKKIFVADNLAGIVDPVFNSMGPYHGIQVLIALYAFAFQIYCDFSGYTDMARGLAKIMGFDLMLNFNLPYFAADPSDFWKRWHISLSSWLRDYLYIPLGGNRKGEWSTYRNIMLTMLLGGLWHGASWHFVIWGGYHGCILWLYKFLAPYFENFPKIRDHLLRNIWKAVRILFFFHLTCLGWLFFRAGSFAQIADMFHALLRIFFRPIATGSFKNETGSVLFFIAFLMVVQALQFLKKDLMAVLKLPAFARAGFYVLIFYSMVIWGTSSAKEFIYFQF